MLNVKFPYAPGDTVWIEKCFNDGAECQSVAGQVKQVFRLVVKEVTEG